MADRIPPINCLITFEALARIRSVTQTAHILCVSPSAISHRIKLLETIVQRQLFRGNDFSLTEGGQVYFEAVSEVLRALKSCSFHSSDNTPVA
jgi:DNA-binding transcriptional LysR family regulator